MAEVNKVNSWEDVISDNYNSEPIVEEQLEEAVVVEDVINDEVIVEDNSIITEEAVIPQEQVSSDNVPDISVGEIDSQGKVTEDVVNAKEDINLLNSGMSEDEIFEYLSLKRTNYNEINDVDIVSGIISSENPNWDTDDIEFELEQKYGSALFEEKVNIEEIDKDIYPEEYKEALLWNKQHLLHPECFLKVQHAVQVELLSLA